MKTADHKADYDKNIAEYVVNNIDVAIENGWVKVFYQPVIRTLTGQLCGAESLARWIDPVHGFLEPDKFISPLEDSGQIHKLDNYMEGNEYHDGPWFCGKRVPCMWQGNSRRY